MRLREAKETETRTPRIGLGQRMLGAVDLAIEFATLGEYGLEPLPAGRLCRERPGQVTGWEALAAGRSRGCDAGAREPRRTRVR